LIIFLNCGKQQHCLQSIDFILMLENKKKIYIIATISLIALLILGYFSCSSEKTEKEKYAELKKKIDNYYTMKCDSINKIILADSILTNTCIAFLNEYPKSIHFNEIKSLVGKNLDYKVGDCLKENMTNFIREYKNDYLNQSVVLTLYDTSVISVIDSILIQNKNLERYFDKKYYDFIDLENQLNYMKSGCLFAYKWISAKKGLFEKLNKSALETAYNFLSPIEWKQNNIDEIENMIFQEDSTVKFIFTPSQERIVQFDLIYSVKLNVLPSRKSENNKPGIRNKLRNIFYDATSIITESFSPDHKLVKVSGYLIGKVDQNDALIDIKSKLLLDSCRIIN